ncbi:hypothetical protein ACU7M0_36370, partial [Burkholderia cenocepacia]
VDLAEPGTQRVITRPETASKGGDAYPAACGFQQQKGATDRQAHDFEKLLVRSVPVLGSGGRRAPTTYTESGSGGVLGTLENKVALLNTDSYLIDGLEQRRIFGTIIAVPVQVLQEATDFALALDELHNKLKDLTDTVRFSQQDPAMLDELVVLHAVEAPVSRIQAVSTIVSANHHSVQQQ